MGSPSVSLVSCSAHLAFLAVLTACSVEPLTPIRGDEPVDLDDDAPTLLDESDTPDPYLVNDGLPSPFFPPPAACDELPRLMDVAAFDAVVLDKHVVIATMGGVYSIDPRMQTPSFVREVDYHAAWNVAVTGPEGSETLFASTFDEAILTLDEAHTDPYPPDQVGYRSTLMAQSDSHIIDLAVKGGRLFFTEEVPGRVRSVAFDGSDGREHLNAGDAHQLTVDEAVGDVYVSAWMDGASPGSIGRVRDDGTSEVFFDAYENPGDTSVAADDRYNFYATSALVTDDTHLYFSTYIAPGGVARVDKATGVWGVLVRLPSSFATDFVLDPSGDGLFYGEMDASDVTIGRIMRVETSGAEEPRLVLDCGRSARTLLAYDGFLYFVLDANGSEPFVTRIAID